MRKPARPSIELPENLEGTLSLSFIDTLLGRRSRRFFLGAEIPDGAFVDASLRLHGKPDTCRTARIPTLLRKPSPDSPAATRVDAVSRPAMRARRPPTSSRSERSR